LIIVALSHFTLWYSGIDSAGETVMNVTVCHLVTAGSVAVLGRGGGGGCTLFYFKPQAPSLRERERERERESEIANMRFANLLIPLPHPCSAFTVA
jgi:hypothetical protein